MSCDCVTCKLFEVYKAQNEGDDRGPREFPFSDPLGQALMERICGLLMEEIGGPGPNNIVPRSVAAGMVVGFLAGCVRTAEVHSVDIGKLISNEVK